MIDCSFLIPQDQHTNHLYRTVHIHSHINSANQYVSHSSTRTHDELRLKMRNKIRNRQVQETKSVIRYNLWVQQYFSFKMSQDHEVMIAMKIDQLPVMKFKRILKILSTVTLEQEILANLLLGLRYLIRDKLCVMLLNFLFFGTSASLCEFSILDDLVRALTVSATAKESDYQYISMGFQLVYKIVASQHHMLKGKIDQLAIDQLLLILLNLPQNHVHIKQKVLIVLSYLPYSIVNQAILKFRPRSTVTKLHLINFLKIKPHAYKQSNRKQLTSLYLWLLKTDDWSNSKMEGKLSRYVHQLASEEIIAILKCNSQKVKKLGSLKYKHQE